MKENVRIQANIMKGINDISLKGEIVIFGSTYMAEFPIYELANKCMMENAIYNRSICGLTLKDALEIVEDCVISINPEKVFVALGEEDENDPDAIAEYKHLIYEIRSRLPDCNLYLIGLVGSGQYVENFNRNIVSLCDDKKVSYISFVSKATSQTALQKARFKQLSCFFRNRPLTVSDAFAIANI